MLLQKEIDNEAIQQIRILIIDYDSVLGFSSNSVGNYCSKLLKQAESKIW